MASIGLKMRIFQKLKKKQTSEARRTEKATVIDWGLNCACDSLIGKPVLKQYKRD